MDNQSPQGASPEPPQEPSRPDYDGLITIPHDEKSEVPPPTPPPAAPQPYQPPITQYNGQPDPAQQPFTTPANPTEPPTTSQPLFTGPVQPAFNQPPQWSPAQDPGRPSLPGLSPEQLYAANQPGPVYKSSSKFKWTIGLVVIVLLALAVAGGSYWYVFQEIPKTVFKDSLENALATKRVTQLTQSQYMTTAINYDLANIKNPVLTETSTFHTSNGTIAVAGYGTLQNTYLQLVTDNLTGESTPSTIIPYLNKWVQMRDNGTLNSSIPLGVAAVGDPRSELFGDYVFGNFPAAQRTQLVNYLLQNNVYAYNASQVTTTKLNGQKVYVYHVTENTAKLEAFNKRAAAMIGVSTNGTLFQTAITTLSGKATLYVTANTKQLVKVEIKPAGATTTTTYTYNNKATVPPAPVPQLTYSQLDTALGGLLSF